MNRIIIEKGNDYWGYYLTACVDGRYYPSLGYLACGIRDAIQSYRKQFHLEGRHLKVVDYRKG